jgi:hypothetical protein
MRRAIWELSPLILFTVWLFGALPLIYLNKGSHACDLSAIHVQRVNWFIGHLA